MKKSEFDELFVEIKQKIGPHSAEEVMNTIASYAEDPDKMKAEEIMSFLITESRKYTNDLVYNLFLATVIDREET